MVKAGKRKNKNSTSVQKRRTHGKRTKRVSRVNETKRNLNYSRRKKRRKNKKIKRSKRRRVKTMKGGNILTEPVPAWLALSGVAGTAVIAYLLHIWRRSPRLEIKKASDIIKRMKQRDPDFKTPEEELAEKDVGARWAAAQMGREEAEEEYENYYGFGLPAGAWVAPPLAQSPRVPRGEEQEATVAWWER